MRPRASAVRNSLGASTALLFAAALVLAGCDSGSTSSAASGTTNASQSSGVTTITLSNAAIVGDEIPLVYAQATDLWKQYGLKVDLVLQSTADQFTSLGAGQVNIALGASTGIEAAQKGAPIQIVGDMGTSYTDFLVQKSINSVKDLRGKVVAATSPGSEFNALQDLYLEHYGLSTSDFTTTYFSGGVSAEGVALDHGQIAGVMLEPPAAFTALSGGASSGVHNLERVDETRYGVLTAQMASVNSTWASQHPTAVSKFIEAWRAASKGCATHVNACASALAKQDDVSTAFAKQWIQGQSPDDGFFLMTASQYELARQALSLNDSAVSSVSYKTMVNNKYVNAASGQ
jgi:ABC-type nitrate/sulfonate/bicarbonate transport system substrate-binding protein